MATVKSKEDVLASHKTWKQEGRAGITTTDIYGAMDEWAKIFFEWTMSEKGLRLITEYQMKNGTWNLIPTEKIYELFMDFINKKK